MTKGWSLVTSLYSHDIFLGFILVDYQTGLWEKYLVTGDWSQSKRRLSDKLCKFDENSPTG